MIGSAIGKRYATALFQLASERAGADGSVAGSSIVQKVASDLRSLADTWESSAELRAVFENPQFAIEQKRDVIKSLSERLNVHATVKNVSQMLSDRGRLRHLPEIADAYDRINEKASGRVRAEIVSATKLPESYYQQLTQTLKQATGKDVVLVRREDPSLIGGVVTTVGGRVFDGSLKNRLSELRSQLLASTDPTASANAD